MTLKTVTKHIPHDDKSRAQTFRVLIGILSILCLCYVYFIGSITFNVLARKSLETSSREISSHIAELELEYITLSNSINASYGKERGFVDAKGTIFASRDAAAVALR